MAEGNDAAAAAPLNDKPDLEIHEQIDFTSGLLNSFNKSGNADSDKKKSGTCMLSKIKNLSDSLFGLKELEHNHLSSADIICLN